jgi:hypothetical protein
MNKCLEGRTHLVWWRVPGVLLVKEEEVEGTCVSASGDSNILVCILLLGFSENYIHSSLTFNRLVLRGFQNSRGRPKNKNVSLGLYNG